IKPYRNDNIWNIGDLKNGDKKTLQVSGILVGQNMEDRSFRVSVGSATSDVSKDFDTSLAATSLTMGIRKSFFDLSVEASNNNIATIGQGVPVQIKWQNTLPDKILNAHIVVS